MGRNADLNFFYIWYIRNKCGIVSVCVELSLLVIFLNSLLHLVLSFSLPVNNWFSVSI